MTVAQLWPADSRESRIGRGFPDNLWRECGRKPNAMGMKNTVPRPHVLRDG
jgi:hypothetical protein